MSAQKHPITVSPRTNPAKRRAKIRFIGAARMVQNFAKALRG